MKIAYYPFAGFAGCLRKLQAESVLKRWVVDMEKSKPNRHRLGIYSRGERKEERGKRREERGEKTFVYVRCESHYLRNCYDRCQLTQRERLPSNKQPIRVGCKVIKKKILESGGGS